MLLIGINDLTKLAASAVNTPSFEQMLINAAPTVAGRCDAAGLTPGPLPAAVHMPMPLQCAEHHTHALVTCSVHGIARSDGCCAGLAPPARHRIQNAVTLLQQRLPTSRIILLGLLPCGTWGLPGRAVYTWPSPYARALPVVNTKLRCGGGSRGVLPCMCALLLC